MTGAIDVALAEHRCNGAAHDDPTGLPTPQCAGADVASVLPDWVGEPGGRPVGALSGCAGDEGGHDVSGVPIKRHPGPVVAHGGARVGVGGGFLDIAKRDPGVEGGGDERCRSVRGPTVLAIPARRVTRWTMRAAPCRSSRFPSVVMNNGPSVR